MNVRKRYSILFLIFVVLGVYYPSLFAPPLSLDDSKMFSQLNDLRTIDFKGLFLPGGVGYYYRPLLYLSFITDHFIWGLQPSFMHLENIVLHAANVVLVFFITLRVAKQLIVVGTGAAMGAALVFALHPINTEPVNWISGRTDLMAGFFVLLSALLLLVGLDKGQKLYGYGAAAAFFIACFAKETAFFFLPAAFILILFHDRHVINSVSSFFGHAKHRFIEYGIIVSGAAAYLYVRHLAFAKADTAVGSVAKGVVGSDSNIYYTAKVVLKASGFYAKKLFIPWPLNFGIVSIPDYYILAGVLILVLLGVAAWRGGLINGLFISAFLMGSSAFLVPLGKMAWTPLAERYMYIPSAFFVIAGTFSSLAFLRPMGKAAVTVAAMVCCVFAYGTVSRNFLWQDNVALFRDVVKKSPGFPTARNQLAAALMAQGKKEEAFDVLKSIKGSTGGMNGDVGILNRAMVLHNEGKYAEAVTLLENNLRDDNRLYPEFVERLILIEYSRLAETKTRKEADVYRENVLRYLQKLENRTSDPFVSYRVAKQYLSLGRKAEASAAFSRAYHGAPEDSHYKLAAKKLAEKLALQ